MQLTDLSSRVIPATEYRRERWRNQLGWTREILRLGEPDDAWALRLSIAEIEQDAAFSAFPGIDRELVLLRGNGMQLQFGDGRQHSLLPPYQRLRFAGEEAVTAVLGDGPTSIRPKSGCAAPSLAGMPGSCANSPRCWPPLHNPACAHC